MIYNVKDVVLSVVVALLVIAGFGFGLSFLTPLTWDQLTASWPPAVQATAAVVGSGGLLAAALFATVPIAAIVMGLVDAWKERHVNHRFADESTPGRIVVARYSKAGDRDVILDVPLDGKRLWLAPSTDPFNGDEYVALLDHAPLYRRSEGEIGLPYDEPTLDSAHVLLWTGSPLERGKRAKAEREAIDAVVAAGAVTLHVDADTWEPTIPADAKFRTTWNRPLVAQHREG